MPTRRGAAHRPPEWGSDRDRHELTAGQRGAGSGSCDSSEERRKMGSYPPATVSGPRGSRRAADQRLAAAAATGTLARSGASRVQRREREEKEELRFGGRTAKRCGLYSPSL